MITKYRDCSFNKASLNLLEKIKLILLEFDELGLSVTLRQLYYQLVSKDLIKNNKKEYDKISRLITNARYAGLIDWEAIEDRIRIPKIPTTFESPEELIKVALESYSLDKWQGQNYYVELWTEKDAISSVISPITQQWQVPLVVNRGYSSASAMYEAAQRFESKYPAKPIILYLGDHDPSGLDMDRDIKERLIEFGVNVIVRRIGLTYEQIQQYSPPPNFAKITDTRAREYINQYGGQSWEVDSLRPDILQELIKTEILNYLDFDRWEVIADKEESDRQKLLNWRLQ